MKFIKFLLKILLSPVFLIITLIYWFATFLIGIASMILNILATVLVITGVFVIFNDGLKDGLFVLFVAWAVSPYGIPMFAQFVAEAMLAAKNGLKGLLA